jgi:2,5-diketo-D-gluconate reductase B
MIVRELHGTRVPALGFGTYELLGAACEEGVLDALEIGYRHIDTARAYDNESEVGRALAASGLPREDLWVTSKVWFTDLSAGDVRASAEHSLSELGLDYLDLLLIHWPNSGIPLEETLSAMVSLREEGLIRHIGVSNFTPSLMCEALDLASILCNQVEFHPFLGQNRLLELARDEGFLLTAYSPMAKGEVVRHPILEQIGRQHGKNPGQVALRWLLQHPNVAAIPRSGSPRHRRSNFDIFDFELSRDEMRLIQALPKDERRVNPPFAPAWED